MYHRGDDHPEKKYWIERGLANHPKTSYEEVLLTKIIIGTQINPIGLVKVKTNIPPRVEKNSFGEYRVIDGRHRLFNFYLQNFPLPHEIKVGCLVEYHPTDGHYVGYNIWQAAEKMRINPRRSFLRKCFNYFGLFRKDSNLFALDSATPKNLDRRTKLLLEAVEDALDHLYQDFIARICEFSLIIKRNSSEDKPEKIKKQFAQYLLLLSKLIQDENEEESLLHKLLYSLKSELKKPSLRKNESLIFIIKILEGDEEKNGLITILRNQQKIIRTGNIQNKKKLEQELAEELQYAKRLLNEKRDRLFNQLRELTRYDHA